MLLAPKTDKFCLLIAAVKLNEKGKFLTVVLNNNTKPITITDLQLKALYKQLIHNIHSFHNQPVN